MRLFSVLLATLLGGYMMIRSVCRLLKHGRNVNEDLGACESVLVDFFMLLLGIFLLLPLLTILLI
ncbi:MAG: hypothetical protein E7440_02845 [Ruminococcaceae bacterium]|nr:hypothetical protein [Oscillospiraceae bacterium]